MKANHFIVTFATRTSFVLMTLGSLGGCAAQNDEVALGPLDESVAQSSAALSTGVFRLKNYRTGLCVGLPAGTTRDGVRPITWDCEANMPKNQQWRFRPSSEPGYVMLENQAAANLCLERRGPWIDINNLGCYTAMEDGCYDYFNTQWNPIYVGRNFENKECYRIANGGGGVLGVLGGNTGWGGKVVTWKDFADQYGHPDQIWCVYDL